MPIVSKLTLLFLACFWGVSLASAQDTKNPDTKKLGVDDLVREAQETDEVSVASKTLTKISQAPSVVSLVNRKQIDQYGYVSMNDALYRQPSFLPTRDYDRRTVSARGNFEGWNANHLLFLVDGVPMNDNFLGTAYTSEMTPLVFTKSLEIIRGTGSALYGSNAMNGVVNMRTLKASDLRGVGEARVRVGSLGTWIYDAVGGASSSQASFLIGFNHFRTQGEKLSLPDGSGRLDSMGQHQVYPYNDKRSSHYFFFKVDGRDKFKGFSLQFHKQHWNFGNGAGFFSYAPDQSENMDNDRELIALRYNTPSKNTRLQQEYVLRYQRSEIDWNTRIYPDSVPFAKEQFPFGMTEHLNTHLQDIFARAQWNYSFENGSSIIGGLESTTVFYKGDKVHFANVDFTQDSITTNVNNKMLWQPSVLEWIEKRPVWNVSAFAQYVSPRWFDKLQATVGLRYDRQIFRYKDLNDSLLTIKGGGFSQLSPRLSLVFNARENLTCKLMAGRAFRTPSVGELFGTNGYLFTSNFNLIPEYITSFEFQNDWHINNFLTWRGNIFYTIFENQIDYSDDILRNLYTTNNAGIENEVLFNGEHWSGFVNYTFTAMLKESLLDTVFFAQANRLTSFPTHALKGGVTYRNNRFYASVNVMYQSKVYRRGSDQSNYIYENSYLYRPEVLPAWVRADFKVSYKLLENVELGLLVNNALNTQDFLIRRLPHAFDYHMEKRNFLVDLRFWF